MQVHEMQNHTITAGNEMYYLPPAPASCPSY